MSFVADDFVVPVSFDGPGFRMEPLGPEHNERDYDAWMPSIEHIRATPGFPDGSWPREMTLESNLADLVRHAEDFKNRSGFTYSILEGDDIIGCLYIYPSKTADAAVSSWVRATHAEMDVATWQAISSWLKTAWPFKTTEYSAR
ncbi:MAG: N-acetyltransferase [Actinobacteria bacterium]|nr:N-acetyltransferase [Actinomycetota bacterium]